MADLTLEQPGSSLLLAPAALDDIRAALLWSLERFGEEAALRYRALLLQALRDLQANPERPGSRPRPELHPGARTYHLALSRARVPDEPVRRPRHFILYRASAGGLEIARVLHDRCDLERYRPDDWAGERNQLPGED